MWQTVQIPVQTQINQLRWTFSRQKPSFFKQVGLRRLRDAQRLGEANRDQASALINEAIDLLQKAKLS